jgi:predicted nicotinamide N-methyase
MTHCSTQRFGKAALLWTAFVLSVTTPLVVSLSSGGFATINVHKTASGGVIKTGAPIVETIDLGENKVVNLFVPPEELHRQFEKAAAARMKSTASSSSNNHYYGTGGDVLGPSNLALARLIAHCPSFVNDRNVLELGCGLGLVSAAAAKHAAPNHLALTDIDGAVLAKAYSSCTQLNRSRSASVSRCVMDWEDNTSWPNQNYDVVLAADVLHNKAKLSPLVQVLQYYLSSDGQENGKGNDDNDNKKRKRALIVDPVHRLNRDSFCYSCYKAGLEADPMPFPGMDDFVLISVTPM